MSTPNAEGLELDIASAELTSGLVTVMFGATGTLFNVIAKSRNDWKVRRTSDLPSCDCHLTPASPLQH